MPQKVKTKPFSDVVQTILACPRTGPGGGIQLTRGEAAMLSLDSYAGEPPNLLDIRSQAYGTDNLRDGLIPPTPSSMIPTPPSSGKNGNP